MNNTEIIVASCQQLAVQWLDTVKLAGLFLATFILIAIVLRIFAVIYLTIIKKNQIENSSIKKLPKWIVRFADAHSFPASKIKINIKNEENNAYTLGLFQPIIVINQDLLRTANKKEIEAILLHEIYHFKKLHSLTVAISSLVAETFFFLPAISDLSKQFSNYCEQSADKFVVKEQKTNLYLLNALKKILTQLPSDSHNLAIATFSTNSVESRITAIKENRFVIDLPVIKHLLVSVSILCLFGILTVSSQKIQASVPGQVLENNVAGSCNVWQCASSCFSKNQNFTPNINQSEL